jgi:hypothetical protein
MDRPPNANERPQAWPMGHATLHGLRQGNSLSHAQVGAGHADTSRSASPARSFCALPTTPRHSSRASSARSADDAVWGTGPIRLIRRCARAGPVEQGDLGATAQQSVGLGLRQAQPPGLGVASALLLQRQAACAGEELGGGPAHGVRRAVAHAVPQGSHRPNRVPHRYRTAVGGPAFVVAALRPTPRASWRCQVRRTRPSLRALSLAVQGLRAPQRLPAVSQSQGIARRGPGSAHHLPGAQRGTQGTAQH